MGTATTSEERFHHIGAEIAALRRQSVFLCEMQERMGPADDGQVSPIDPDTCSMATNGLGTGIVVYKVQIAVDPAQHLVVAHDVVNEPMIGRSLCKWVMGSGEPSMRGRAWSKPSAAAAATIRFWLCEGTGIVPAMLRAAKLGRARKALFVRVDFVYAAAADHAVCPARAMRTKSAVGSDRHGDIDHFSYLEARHACAMRTPGTTGTVKCFKRWKHEAMLEAIQRRLDAVPDAVAVRRDTHQHAHPHEGPKRGECRDEPRRRREVDDLAVRRYLAHPGPSSLKRPSAPPP
ncbi:hypothetical protein ACRBEV_29305 [Methylobacterium phyllosphaerae]